MSYLTAMRRAATACAQAYERAQEGDRHAKPRALALLQEARAFLDAAINDLETETKKTG